MKGILCPGDGFWGDYSDWDFCPAGTYVNGYHMRVERPQGKDRDDTALNSVEVLCVNAQGGAKKISPHLGWWGDWEGWDYCPATAGPMVAAAILIEGKQGSENDDTAANAVKFLCRDGSEREAPHSTSWGEWSNWAKCPSGQAICGLQLRIEGKQGDNKDDTAVNGARFACCAVP